MREQDCPADGTGQTEAENTDFFAISPGITVFPDRYRGTGPAAG